MEHKTHAKRISRGIERVIITLASNWKAVALLAYFFGVAIAIGIHMNSRLEHIHPVQRRWGGYGQQPQNNKCYRQERVAMLLSLFLGNLGVDQFYAHHWLLAGFKLLTFGGLGVWSLVDVILWIVGGVYGTPGCPGGSSIGWQY
ncbi:TM2 domain-containing protein [Paramyrothecium foliicola]|nr:TM2 domain-containing protein [Paramyrothecium foliicola]